MKITYIRSTVITDQPGLIENVQNDKQIDDFLDTPKRPKAPKHIFWDWNIENQVQTFEKYGSKFKRFEKHETCAP